MSGNKISIMGLYIGSNYVEGVSIYKGGIRQSKNVAPLVTQQTIYPDAEYDSLQSVTISAVTSAIDSNIKAENIKDGVTILGVTGSLQSGSAPVNYRLPWDPFNTNLVTATLTINVTIVCGVYVLFFVNGDCDTVYQIFTTSGTYNLTVLAGSWMVGWVYRQDPMEGSIGNFNNITYCDLKINCVNYNECGYFGKLTSDGSIPLNGTMRSTIDSPWCGYPHLLILNSDNNIFSSISYSFSITVDDRGCFIKGTKITLADGSYKNCEDITLDDELLVWDFYKGGYTSAKPLFIQKKKTSPCYNKLTFSDGTVVGYVGHKEYHRIFNQQSGKFTGTASEETPIGTITFKDDRTTPTLVSKEMVYEDIDYYNIITENHYNCFTNGILSSCRLSNQYAISDMKYVGDALFDDTYVSEYLERLKNNGSWLYRDNNRS